MLFAYLVTGLALCVAYGLGVLRLHRRHLARAVAAATQDLERRLEVARTALARAGTAVQDQDRRLAAADGARAELLAGLARAIRTPAAHVLGFAQLMDPADAAPLGARQRRMLAGMETAAARLLAVADEAMVLASARDDGPDPSIQRLDLRLALRQACDGLAPEARAAGVALACPPAGAGQGVLADPARLRRILRRLILDALRHAPTGGTVRLDIRRFGARTQARVHDGRRPAPERLDDLFAPFAAVVHAPGAAPGLAAARRLAETMQATLTAAEADEGVVFTLDLPAAAPVSPMGLERVTVLHLCDDPAAATLMRRAAETLGFALHRAAGADEGLELARALGPDVALLDLDMAEAGRLADELAADPAVRAIPVVGVGGDDGTAVVRLRLDKPLDLEALKAALAGLSTPPEDADARADQARALDAVRLAGA